VATGASRVSKTLDWNKKKKLAWAHSAESTKSFRGNISPFKTNE
jgi:hypothetical protein